MIGKWKKIKTEGIHQCGKFYRIEKDKVITPGKKDGTYYVIRRDQGSVVIIALDEMGNIYLTKQHRYPVNKFSLEFPAGAMDKSDSSLGSAKRELAEEISMASNNWKKVGKYTEVLGMSSLQMNVFLAEKCYKLKKESRDPMDNNLHETVAVKYNDLRKKVAEGKIFDSVTLCAFAIAETQGIFDKYKK